MRHDYDLPPDWAAMSDEEKDEWFHEERSRRAARRQDTPFSRRLERAEERQQRKVEARSQTVNVER